MYLSHISCLSVHLSLNVHLYNQSCFIAVDSFYYKFYKFTNFTNFYYKFFTNFTWKQAVIEPSSYEKVTFIFSLDIWYLQVVLSLYLCIHLSSHPPIISTPTSTYLHIYPPVFLLVHLSVNVHLLNQFCLIAAGSFITNFL